MTEQRTPMTADELAAELYRRQGFLVLFTVRRHRVGAVISCDIPDETEGVCAPLTIPMRVLGKASRLQIETQMRNNREILGYECDLTGAGHAYRVEAAD